MVDVADRMLNRYCGRGQCIEQIVVKCSRDTELSGDCIINCLPSSIAPATSKTWTRTLKNLDPEKPGINIRLKNMSDFRELCFITTMRNVIYCLKVRVLTDI